MSVLHDKMKVYERQLLQTYLAKNRWRRGATADELGITRVTLWNKMKKHNLLNDDDAVITLEIT